MKVQVIDTTGKKKGEVTLPKELFGVEPNQDLLAQYVRIYRHRQRQASAIAQTRSDVTGTTAKVWRQKGTGRARHGSRKAPIFVKGGQAHGPTGMQNYKLTLSKKMRKQALISALSSQSKIVTILEGLEKVGSKTKDLSQALSKSLEWKNTPVTIVLDTPMDGVIRASKNLTSVDITQASRLNAFEIIRAKQLIFTQKSLDILVESITSKKTTQTETSESKKS